MISVSLFRIYNFTFEYITECNLVNEVKMKLLSLLTSSRFLILLQLSVSSWFLIDFLVARDSITASSWRHGSNKLEQNDRVASLANNIRNRHCHETADNNPLFDKVVLIVIDALGSKFIPSMPFVHDSIQRNRAMSFVAKAATPTVTMPRIKALLSGTNPSFIDLISNLARDVSNFKDDNILRIAHANNKSIVFYGDDTWLTLFNRKMFLRAQETYSFFASDYTTVDTNVTKFAIPESKRDPIDWDFLILHYLGLDHIGHVYGTNESPVIDKKLLEMDDIIKTIYDNMSKTEHKTLMVICGDHGMSEEGNHGGSSKLESETAQVFLPINRVFFNYQAKTTDNDHHIRQIDFATNLAFMTNLPTPSSSKGVACAKLLSSLWNDERKLNCAAFENVMQLFSQTSDEKFKSKLVELLELDFDQDKNVLQRYFDLANEIQDSLLEIIASNSNPPLLITIVSLATLLTLINIRRTSIRLLLASLLRREKYLLILVFLTPILFHGSTDFIEREYLFWPIYCSISIALFIAISDLKQLKTIDPLRAILLVITLVLTSLWNRLPLIGVNKTAITSCSVAAFAFLGNNMMQSSDFPVKYRKFIVLPLSIAMICCKLIEDSPEYDLEFKILFQRFIIIALVVYNVANSFFLTDISRSSKDRNSEEELARFVRKLATTWLTIAFVLSRQRNLLFLMANVIMEASINSIIDTLRLSRLTRILIYIHLAQAAFYNQGNTNLFTTIDVRPAFFGQTDYNLITAVILVSISTFSTQIYWYLKLNQRIQTLRSSDDNSETVISTTTEFVTMRNFLSLSYYMYVCIVLRNHLFIWSVISPKLVYHYVSNNIILLSCLIISNIYHIKRSGIKSIITSQEHKEQALLL